MEFRMPNRDNPVDLPISLIIPTHNRPFRLHHLLYSMVENGFEVDSNKFELLIISNLKDQRVFEVVEQYKKYFDIHYHFVGQVGVNRARNLGLRMSRSNLCGFLDDDCEILNPNWLNHALKIHGNHPELTGYGGYYRLLEGPTAAGRVYHVKFNSWLDFFVDQEGFAHRLLGGCMFLCKDKLGDMSFDENIIIGGAETSLIAPLSFSGAKLMLSDSLSVGHHFDLGGWTFVKKVYLQGLRDLQIQISQSRNAFRPSASFLEIQTEHFKEMKISSIDRVKIKFFLRLHSVIFHQLPRMRSWVFGSAHF